MRMIRAEPERPRMKAGRTRWCARSPTADEPAPKMGTQPSFRPNTYRPRMLTTNGGALDAPSTSHRGHHADGDADHQRDQHRRHEQDEGDPDARADRARHGLRADD